MIPLPPRAMQDWVGSKTDEDFIAWGGYYWRRLAARFGLRPDSRLLEIGCGPGSLARWVVPRLSPAGHYVGFDVNEEAIAWCREHIPGGEFHHAPVRNGAYAPKQDGTCADYRFPAEDGSVDVLFAGSVFTHLLRGDAEPYLREIARVLAPTGQALATMMIVPNDVESVRGPSWVLPRQPTGEYAASEWLVAHPWKMVVEMAQASGLIPTLTERGTWQDVMAASGNPDVWLQDSVGLVRA